VVEKGGWSKDFGGSGQNKEERYQEASPDGANPCYDHHLAAPVASRHTTVRNHLVQAVDVIRQIPSPQKGIEARDFACAALTERRRRGLRRPRPILS
jgi:hypothetical protein